MNYLSQFLRDSLNLWVNMSPYLLLGMMVGGILHAFLREDFIIRHLGSSTFRSVLNSTLFGIPLPLCSCGVIPVAATLRRDGASRSSTLAFLVSTPTTGVDSILATYSLLGPLFAVFRPLASFLSGLLVGSLHFLTAKEEGEVACVPPPKDYPKGRLYEALRYGFGELPRDIGKWLVIGILVGGALSALVPPRAFEPLRAHPLLEFLLILAFSVPLYVCATGSIPIAAALLSKGISPGAVLVFLIAGPATNTVTVSFVYSQLGKRATVLYLASIVGSAFFLGWTFNGLWRYLGGTPELFTPGGELLPPWVRGAAGVVLLVVVARALLSRYFEKGGEVVGMKYTFKVPGMSCEHCKAAIERALKGLEGVQEVVVDLKNKTVGVEGEVNKEVLERVLAEAGYPPEG